MSGVRQRLNPSTAAALGTTLSVVPGNGPQTAQAFATVDNTQPGRTSQTNNIATWGALGLLVAGIVGYVIYAWVSTSKVSDEDLQRKKILPTVHTIITISIGAILGIVFLKLGITSLRINWAKSPYKPLNWIANVILAPVAKFIQIA